MSLFIWCISFFFPFQMNFPKFTFQIVNYSYIFCLFLGLCFFFSNFSAFNCYFQGLPGGVSDKGSTCPHRRCNRHGFDPWVGDICVIPGSGKPSGVGSTPVFLPGKFHGQRSPAGYSPRGLKVRHD